MQVHRVLSFTLISVAAGLAAALIAMQLLVDRDPRPTPVGSPLPQQSGPVSYAAAVERAVPAVVNILNRFLFVVRSTAYKNIELSRGVVGGNRLWG